MEGVVKPNVSPNKKKDGKDGTDGQDDGEGEADGDTAKKKKGKEGEVRLMEEELILLHLSPLLSYF